MLGLNFLLFIIQIIGSRCSYFFCCCKVTIVVYDILIYYAVFVNCNVC